MWRILIYEPKQKTEKKHNDDEVGIIEQGKNGCYIIP